MTSYKETQLVQKYMRAEIAAIFIIGGIVNIQSYIFTLISAYIWDSGT